MMENMKNVWRQCVGIVLSNKVQRLPDITHDVLSRNPSETGIFGMNNQSSWIGGDVSQDE